MKARVKKAEKKLRKAINLAGTRYLANFAAHSSAIPYAGAPARVVKGRVVLPIPDPPKGRVEILGQLQYKGRRHLESFADGVLVAVDAFIEETLSAFECEVRTIRTERDSRK